MVKHIIVYYEYWPAITINVIYLFILSFKKVF